MRREAASIAEMPAAYIVGEFLAEYNEPSAFRDFCGAAARHRLDYLCEGDIPSTLPETLHPAAAARIRQLAGAGERLAVQHFLDLFSGRTFRRSLLVRGGRLRGPEPLLDAPARLAGLHIAATPMASRPLGRVGTDMAPAEPILRRLADMAPATHPVAALADGSDACEAGLVWDLVRTGRAVLHTVPIVVGHAPVTAAATSLELPPCAAARAPCAFAPARLNAADGQRWAASIAHGAVAIDAMGRLLLPLLDGTRSFADLVAVVAAAEVSVHPGGTIPGDRAAAPPGYVGTRAQATTARALEHLASAGLLMP